MTLEDLSSSIWVWYLDKNNGDLRASGRSRRSSTIPAEPASPDDLPPLLKGFKAVPPLVTDINLSVDDKFLYVSCWGTGEFRQYDVSNPFHPTSDRFGPARRHRRANRAPRATRASRSTAVRRWSS